MTTLPGGPGGQGLTRRFSGQHTHQVTEFCFKFRGVGDRFGNLRSFIPLPDSLRGECYTEPQMRRRDIPGPGRLFAAPGKHVGPAVQASQAAGRSAPGGWFPETLTTVWSGYLRSR